MGRGAVPRGPCRGAGFAQQRAPPQPPAAPPWPRAIRPRAAWASQRARSSAAAREPKEAAAPPAGQPGGRQTRLPRRRWTGRVRTAGAPDLAGGGVSKALCLMASLFTEFTL